MSLGFSVEALLPHARVSGRLRMGLVAIDAKDWLDPSPDLAARTAAFDLHADSVKVLPEGEAAAREAAQLLGAGNLESAARGIWEDLCVLTQDGPGEPYRLTAAAVAFPTDWRVAEKMGLPLTAVHAPIHGYAERLSSGVDRFLDALGPGDIFGRANLFIVPSDTLRYLPQDDPAAHFAKVTAANAGRTLFARCERQTLRRLPETGAIVFTIGIYRAALESLSDRALARIASTIGGFAEPEDSRRRAPLYAAALSGYAASRNCAQAA